MAVQTLAAYAWGFHRLPNIRSARIKISFRKHDGHQRVLYYEMVVTELTEENIVVRIIRQKGGINCQIKIERNSSEEGTRTTAEHSQQHVSGLKELSKIRKYIIEEGTHRNSLAYRDFSARKLTPDRKRWEFKSEMITDDKKNYRYLTYTAVIESVSLG